MYIPEFWVGVLTTVGVEVVALIVAAVVMSANKK